MDIQYKNVQIRKVCTSAQIAEKKYGNRMAEIIQLRIDQIQAADTVEEMIQFRIGRCHPLVGNRKNQYAVDLLGAQRLIFEKIGKEIQIANIMEIADYH